jgi:uncharacterized membrane protein YecN with MAPEG domain
MAIRALENIEGKSMNSVTITPVLRGQQNFVEYVPLTVILIALAEAGGSSALWVHGMGAALLVARVLHPLGLTSRAGVNPLRSIGTNLT